MRLLLASLILAATTASAIADEPAKTDAAKGDLAKLQGKWMAMVGPEKNIPIVVVIKDKTMTLSVTYQGQERSFSGEVKLDETKTPKEWTSSKFKGEGGEDMPDNLSIYKIDGDTLTLCSGGPGGDRPTKFAAGEGGPPNLTDFKRVKDDAKKEEPKK